MKPEVVCMTGGDFLCAESSYRENSPHRRLCMIEGDFSCTEPGYVPWFLGEFRVTAAPCR